MLLLYQSEAYVSKNGPGYDGSRSFAFTVEHLISFSFVYKSEITFPIKKTGGIFTRYVNFIIVLPNGLKCVQAEQYKTFHCHTMQRLSRAVCHLLQVRVSELRQTVSLL